jgi:quinohemoprotein amine dehydrogenase
MIILMTIVLLTFPGESSADEGLPVESELIRNACGTCHQIDARNMMSRISYLRKSPEGWQETIKRMLRLGYVQLSPDEARTVVRYLADNHCLTPSEARLVSYAPEKRWKHEELPDSEDFRNTCTACHLGARPLAQRRTAEEWQLLKGMHLGYFPRAPFQDERRSEQDPEATEEDRADRAFEYLAQNYAFDNPEWRSFRAKKTIPDLSGRWLVVTYERGKGLVAGELLMEKSGDDYQTRSTLVSSDGGVERREGTGILYAGYSWRGSSKGNRFGELKEVLMLSDDGASLSGRFYRGVYGELGLDDVTLFRLGAEPRIAGVLPRSLPAPSSAAKVRIVGANFPSNLGPEDVDLGPGVLVKALTVVGPEVLEVLVDVAENALPGSRNLSAGAATIIIDAFAVYDRIDYVKVRPDDGMARVGGVQIPKQFVQFEAVAFHRGADGKPFTTDDIELGPVVADWSLEEYHIRFGDDDLRYVGTIDETGLFTPNVEGPNPDRSQENNIGDVWVVATYVPEGATRPLKGRAHLLVTVPIYTLWDFSLEYTQ